MQQQAETLSRLDAAAALAFHRKLTAALRNRPLTSLDYALGLRLQREFNHQQAAQHDGGSGDKAVTFWLPYAHILHQMEPVQSRARELAQEMVAWLPPPVQTGPPAQLTSRGAGPTAQMDEQMDFRENFDQRTRQRSHQSGEDRAMGYPSAAFDHPQQCDVCRMKGRSRCWLAALEDAKPASKWAAAYQDSLHTATELFVPPLQYKSEHHVDEQQFAKSDAAAKRLSRIL
eukprot:SAG31_NODE_10962_length_1078_cov_1.295199_2_plen_229_part_01